MLENRPIKFTILRVKEKMIISMDTEKYLKTFNLYSG